MSAPLDPLQALSAALAVPANSQQQAELLSALRENLEQHPNPIPILCSTLIKTIANAGDSLLKRWVLDLLHFAICRSSLSLEAKTQLSLQSLDTLHSLIHDPHTIMPTTKVVIQILTSVYPLIFRGLCMNRAASQPWEVFVQCKNRVLELFWTPNTPIGVRLCALKLVQRAILLQTRSVSDPRLQNKSDPSISSVPSDHPFISAHALEEEGVRLLSALFEILYKSRNPDELTAIVNSWPTLIKLRPVLAQPIVQALAGWTPAALAGLPYTNIKSVEKSIRILLMHISRSQSGGPLSPIISETLATQGVRMDRASADEKARKLAAASGVPSSAGPSSSTPVDPSLKRPTVVDSHGGADANKRPKLDPTTTASAAALLAAFDFTSLPASLITELIVANLGAFTESMLVDLVQSYREEHLKPASAAAAAAIGTVAAATATASTSASVAVATNIQPDAAPSANVGDAQVGESDTSAAAAAAIGEKEPVTVKEEPVDPLQMDIDEDELDFEPDKLNHKLSGDEQEDIDTPEEETPGSEALLSINPLEFKLPSPREPSEEERAALIEKSIARIRIDEEKNENDLIAAVDEGDGPDVWMLLVVRMITRVAMPPRNLQGPEEDADGSAGGKKEEDDDVGAVEKFYERQDALRYKLCDYIMADFPKRIRLATAWMNEEWYNDWIRAKADPGWQQNYPTWLNQIVASYQTFIDGKDKTFPQFVLDLPSIPTDILDLLRDLCVDPDRMQVGFTTLREIVVQRPSLREEALRVLLELTTHPEKVTRGAAIITVKRWVPDAQPMDSFVRGFALQMLHKLQLAIPPSKKESQDGDTPMADGTSTTTSLDVAATTDSVTVPANKPQDEEVKAEQDGDENMEDGQLPSDELIQTPYLPERIELPAQKSLVLQHVELLFALSVKAPEFLDEIFTAYGQMDISVQEAIQQLITALIKSLGSNHGKLLTLMRTCPPGAESLALRVLNIFTEHGRPSAQLVAIVKSLINERDLDARFLIPIIAEMDKNDITRYLPRIVSILNGQPEPKNLVRSVFTSVVTTPPKSFGTVSSNLPRVRQSELLTPAELMVLLHESEKEIGLKSAIEAIGICFSMTDVYRSEILAGVMQQIVDEPVLPVLFMRTVIQAVTTYKSLVAFVSTTLLSRLITKKIWTNPPLWEGFIRCAKVIAPASFGALLQLPKDQIRELVDKQPSLKTSLRDFVIRNRGGNKARVAGFLEIFGDAEGTPPASATSAGTPEQAATAASSQTETATPPAATG